MAPLSRTVSFEVHEDSTFETRRITRSASKIIEKQQASQLSPSTKLLLLEHLRGTLRLPAVVQSHDDTSCSMPAAEASSSLLQKTSSNANNINARSRAAVSIMRPSREVASGMVNLGSTCYMNAVLQALAHAPELCLAMKLEPHCINCPIARENEKKRRSTPRPSPESAGSGHSERQLPVVTKISTRKSRRSGKKSPVNDPDFGLDLTYCALCEVEQHLSAVHALPQQQSTNGNSNNIPPVSVGPSSNVPPTEADAIAPQAFVNGFIEKVAPWFKIGVQEDSHEFLRLLIDAMQNSCTKARQLQKSQMKVQNEDESQTSSSPNTENDENKAPPPLSNPQGGDNKTNTDDSKDNINEDNEYPFKLFRGTVESNVTCESCKFSSAKIDPIEDIGLEVTAQQGSCPSQMDASMSSNNKRSRSPPPPVLTDVAGAFQRFIADEPLDSSYKCDKCGKLGKGTKQSRLASIPPILTLHLKRFRYGSDADGCTKRNGRNGGGSRSSRSEVSQLLGSNGDFYGGSSGSAKVEGHVKFDKVFDISPYMTDEFKKQHPRMLCRLFAVVVHAGKNSHSGHYISYVRNVNKDEWWKMDDARVTTASFQEVSSAEAYMLFYRVIEHPVAEELRKKKELAQRDAQKAAAEAAAAAAAKEAEEQAAALLVAQQAVAAAKDANNVQDSKSKNNRKRNKKKRPRDKEPEYVNGESWANATTSFPPSFISILRKAEEFIFDNVDFKPDYMNVLSEQVEEAKIKLRKRIKGGDAVGPGSNITGDDIQGGSNAYRPAIHTLFNKLYTLWVQETDGTDQDVDLFGSGQDSPAHAPRENQRPVTRNNISGRDNVDKKGLVETSLSFKGKKSLIDLPVVEANDTLL